MKKHYLFLLLPLFYFSLNSCSKDGLEGPEGQQGPAGATGEVGQAGKDGSIIYSGVGSPDNSIGAINDYYLDKNTGNLYGPKSRIGWETSIALIGAAGAAGQNGTNGTNGSNGTNGVNGTVTLSGNGAPAIALGNLGDYYLDKIGYQLYGPKSVSGWGIPITLKGADGTQGPAGAAGKDGSIIYSGLGTPDNTIGKNGDYFLNRQIGGLYGPKNVDGWGIPLTLIGSQGATGNTGATGSTGAAGKNGSSTLSGNGAPATDLGLAGDYYLDKTNYLLYGPKITTWGAAILLRGADGAQGPTGPAGADGTIIYSGDYTPDPALGKIGDYFIGKYTVTLYGPKTASGWGSGNSLKGTNGTNGNTILNGSTAPNNTLGKDGDFYINTLVYDIYGPKNNGDWGTATSLKGSNGNNNTAAFETTDGNSFLWNFESDYLVLKRYGTATNDTSSVFSIPPSGFNATKTGITMVYLRSPNLDGTYTWRQLNFTDSNYGYDIFYNYVLRLNPTDAKIRIKRTYEGSKADYLPVQVDKVRIVVAPQSSSGNLSSLKPNGAPMLQTMQTLKLTDKDFKALK